MLNPANWPVDLVTCSSKETESEAKTNNSVLTAALEIKNEFELLEKHTFWRTIRVSTWVTQFTENCCSDKVKQVSGPLTSIETGKQVKWLIKREQRRYSVTEKFSEDQEKLNLQKSEEQIYVCNSE